MIEGNEGLQEPLLPVDGALEDAPKDVESPAQGEVAHHGFGLYVSAFFTYATRCASAQGLPLLARLPALRLTRRL